MSDSIIEGLLDTNAAAAAAEDKARGSRLRRHHTLLSGEVEIDSLAPDSDANSRPPFYDQDLEDV